MLDKLRDKKTLIITILGICSIPYVVSVCQYMMLTLFWLGRYSGTFLRCLYRIVC